jgi:hypothetical protein
MSVAFSARLQSLTLPNPAASRFSAELSAWCHAVVIHKARKCTAAALASFVLCTSACICFGIAFALFSKTSDDKIVGANAEDRTGAFVK